MANCIYVSAIERPLEPEPPCHRDAVAWYLWSIAGQLPEGHEPLSIEQPNEYEIIVIYETYEGEIGTVHKAIACLDLSSCIAFVNDCWELSQAELNEFLGVGDAEDTYPLAIRICVKTSRFLPPKFRQRAFEPALYHMLDDFFEARADSPRCARLWHDVAFPFRMAWLAAGCAWAPWDERARTWMRITLARAGKSWRGE